MQQKGHVIISVTNDLVTDNRVDKVCCFLISEGYTLTLVGRKLLGSKPVSDRSYETKRFRLFFVKGPLFYFEFNFRLFIYLLFRRASILVANDLDTLLANYLASKFKSVKLVYDTHEYFTEVPELVENPRKQKIWQTLEGWIFPKLKNCYTVNDSIAKMYMQRYGVAVKVIRNVAPNFTSLDKKTREDLGLPTDKFIIIIQGSGINKRRGAEEAVHGMNYIEGALLLIIGGGDVIHELKNQVREDELNDKVRFLPKMSYIEMMQYTMNGDLGLAIDHTDVMNHKLALPNKFFDYIQAEIPILATDIIEVRGIIEKYQIGFILEHELTAQKLAAKINEIKSDFFDQKEFLKENLKKAKLIENWENELKKLKEIYLNLN
jgi:glycosyltransferase involved in cell wall biosynthesis